MVRTISGSVITAVASAAPAVVKASRAWNSRHSSPPSGPCTPNSSSSSQPVTTGGSTIGRCTAASSSGRPGRRGRASSQASSSATGRAPHTAIAPTRSVSQTATH